MKLAVLGIVIAIVTGCSINHRSGDYTCTKPSDCATGRTCSTDGFCIVIGSIDAPGHVDAPKVDGAACPAGCTSCNVTQKTCTIDCGITSCSSSVTCPAGYHCDIQCKTDNACRNGVNCLAAASCSVECTGNSSCRNVQCGPGPCDVGCSGPSSCSSEILCNNSCQCDVTCTGTGSCATPPVCTSLQCRSGTGCTSVPALCHSTCP